MERYKYPSPDEWKSITARPHTDTAALHATVRNILEDVRTQGDKAIMRYEEKFDHAVLESLPVSAEEIDNAMKSVSAELWDALTLAHKNISSFHASQHVATHKVETSPGVVCWQKSVPITTVGLYIPGGTAPLFSTVLMLATPAKIAGCPNIIMCTPPRQDGAAKQVVSLQDVAIDMPAGPSEVCVIADDTSNPAYVAADLLSQAEHGSDSQVLLITTSESMADKVEYEISGQLKALPRMDIAAQTLCNSKIVIVKNKEEALALSNMYAPEHLIIATDDNAVLAEKVVNAGSVFLGKYACESAGDYASGTNHTLPTHGYATAYNGVNLDSFVRKITFQHITEEGIRHIGHAVEVMAENEHLYAHKNAMTLRIKDIINE